MPDRRKRRGPHPRDEACFAATELPRLAAAVDDLCWLRERGYSDKAALKLVGDRYALASRQRRALTRVVATPAERRRRAAREVGPAELAGATVVVDGYNVLLTLEAALSGGVLLLARDGTVRDLAAMSAHYRRVDQTRPAIGLLADFFAATSCAGVLFYLDQPVSNSGRLRRLIEATVDGRLPAWRVELARHVDRTLAESQDVVASADSAILDRCGRWLNLARRVVEAEVPGAWLVDLAAAGGGAEPSSQAKRPASPPRPAAPRRKPR